MSATYDSSRLDVSLNAIRFALQDVGPTDWRFSDAEILAVAPGGLMGETSVGLAAATLADTLANRFAGLVDISEGGASASLSQLATQYAALAKRLRAKAGIDTSTLIASCVLDRGPAFTRAMGDPCGSYPW
jgi:hypothetical protein